MNVNTLSAIIGHVSAKTALNIYTLNASKMQENAADSDGSGIAKAKVSQQKADA